MHVLYCSVLYVKWCDIWYVVYGIGVHAKMALENLYIKNAILVENYNHK